MLNVRRRVVGSSEVERNTSWSKPDVAVFLTRLMLRRFDSAGYHLFMVIKSFYKLTITKMPLAC